MFEYTDPTPFARRIEHTSRVSQDVTIILDIKYPPEFRGGHLAHMPAKVKTCFITATALVRH
jgi:hypothetical protein